MAKKNANTGGKRGWNGGRTVCPLGFGIFLRVFEAHFRKRLEVSKKEGRGRTGQIKILKAERDLKHYKYIYAVGGESWPPQGGDLVPSTLPAAEPSILARVKIGNLMLRKPRGFSLPDPPGPGTKFPPQPFLPKTPFETVTEISPKPLFL